MNIEIGICISIGIAIFSIAYPIMVNKTSNIGDKYQSQYIPILFNNEFPQKPCKCIFKKVSILNLSLIFTLISFIPIIFQVEPLWGWDNWFINNSAELLVFALSSILTVLFLIWSNKVILYNGKPDSLLEYIIKKYNSSKEDDEMRQDYLKAINELTYYAVEKQYDYLQKTLLGFYYKTFANIREKYKKELPLEPLKREESDELEYPEDLYFMVYRLNKEATVIQNNKLEAIERSAVSGNWLLGGEIEGVIISEKTYVWLWRNIYTICDYPRLVKMFWANSSQYYSLTLHIIREDYDYTGEIKGVINEEEIKRRNNERDRFIEFHYALGGLTYYRKKYDLLKYFFEYSQSSPPIYVLLPQSMRDIFYWFERFSNEFKNLSNPIDSKYSFPELDNSGNSIQVIYWICRYLTILFIRQYSLTKYLSIQNFTGLPNNIDDIPESELSNWLGSIPFFEKCLNDVIANEELLIVLGYKELVEHNKERFNEFIKDLKELIKDKIREQKLNAELSQEKISHFYENSNKILTKAFEEYKPILTDDLEEEHSKGSLKLSVRGAITLTSKSDFTDNNDKIIIIRSDSTDTDISHLNDDFAYSIARNNIKQSIPKSFINARTRRYLLKQEDLIASLSKLIGENSDDIVIVYIGNIKSQVGEIIKNSSFKDLIKHALSTNPQDFLFVLRKQDLPAIEHKDLSEEEKEELKLVLLNDELKIYASVIEENEEIRNKWNLSNEPDYLDLKVQLALSFLSVIHWKDSREIVQINITSKYREQGIPNTINDIVPFKRNNE
ncbi:MAG: hypothetical protein LBQ84_05830 [Flavobacteriaceae bacterium]|jgi:hypothetical protein|nr:hypothetical protein [Flavobacteriaceae bacterium]